MYDHCGSYKSEVRKNEGDGTGALVLCHAKAELAEKDLSLPARTRAKVPEIKAMADTREGVYLFQGQTSHNVVRIVQMLGCLGWSLDKEYDAFASISLNYQPEENIDASSILTLIQSWPVNGLPLRSLIQSRLPGHSPKIGPDKPWYFCRRKDELKSKTKGERICKPVVPFRKVPAQLSTDRPEFLAARFPYKLECL